MIKKRAEARETDIEDFESVKKNFQHKIIVFYKCSSTTTKILLILLSYPVAFISVRVGLLGTPIQNFSFRFIPQGIWLIDQYPPPLTVWFDFEVDNGGHMTLGKSGNTYKTGQPVQFKLNVSRACWILVIGYDASGYFSVYPEDQIRTIWYTPTPKSNVISAHPLDDTVGYEYYFAFYSKTKFNFDRDIRKELINTINLKGIKGLDTKLKMNLPDGISIKLKHFDHVR